MYRYEFAEPPSVLGRREHYRIVFDDAGYLGVLGPRQGYIGIPPGHKWNDVDDSYDIDLDVHGGITFFEKSTHELHLGIRTRTPFTWIGWDYNHFGTQSDRELGMSYGTIPTAATITEEVIDALKQCRDSLFDS